MKIFILLIIAFFVSGCNPFAQFRPTSDEIVRKGWAKEKKKDAPSPLYCYKTIGDTMCYEQPLAGEQAHLQGSYMHMDNLHDVGDSHEVEV